MRTSLIVGCIAAVLVGCATPARVEYIPADRAVVPLKKGEPAPADGWYVPPAVMQEIVPCLDERFREDMGTDTDAGADTENDR